MEAYEREASVEESFRHHSATNDVATQIGFPVRNLTAGQVYGVEPTVVAAEVDGPLDDSGVAVDALKLDFGAVAVFLTGGELPGHL